MNNQNDNINNKLSENNTSDVSSQKNTPNISENPKDAALSSASSENTSAENFGALDNSAVSDNKPTQNTKVSSNETPSENPVQGSETKPSNKNTFPAQQPTTTNAGNVPNNSLRSTTPTNKANRPNTPPTPPNKELRVNTSANIKKAAAKKVLTKGAKTAGFTLKKALQWILNAFLTLLLMCTICGIIIGGAFAIYVKNNLIDEDFDIPDLKAGLDMTTKIYCKDPDTGEYVELEDERIYGDQNRSWVSFQKMPKKLYNAFVAIEDERFFEHNGVDWKRTFGAVLQFASGNDSYGGSTITQQLIKNTTGEDDTTIQRKVSEIFRALTLSEKRSKEEVLEMYLNTINLSRRNYGVQAAANYYFGKDVSDLTLVECAALASIPKSPTKYDPVRNPENNKARRKLVIDKMYELKMISKEEWEQSRNADLELNITLEESLTDFETPYSYYKDALIEQLIVDFEEQYGYTREYASNLIYSGGLSIYITMDQDVQAAMDEVYEDPNSFRKITDGIQPESAMVVMDPYNGDVLGIVGGRGEKTGRRELNRATQSKRQVGSSIKPITVYAPAVDLGLIDYSTLIDDSPVDTLNGRSWPRNSPNRYDGRITVNEAIYRSKNTVAVKVLRMLDVDYAFDFAKNKLHLTSLVESDRSEAPLALGGLTHGLTVLEMTAAYTIFPNQGNYSAPRFYTKVLDSEGATLLENKVQNERVISKNSASVMTKMLQNVVSTGTAARITLDTKVNVAGKTGSTNDNKDLYFVGYTPYYVAACWFGYDIPKNLNAYTTNPSMIAWELVMEKIHQKHFERAASGEEPLKTFEISSMVSVRYCLDSGLLATPECEIDVRTITQDISRIGTAYYLSQSDAPKKSCTVHTAVKWDKTNNCIANEYCPPEDVIDASLVDVEDRYYKDSSVVTVEEGYTYQTRKECTVHTQPEEVIENNPPSGEEPPEWVLPPTEQQPPSPPENPSGEQDNPVTPPSPPTPPNPPQEEQPTTSPGEDQPPRKPMVG